MGIVVIVIVAFLVFINMGHKGKSGADFRKNILSCNSIWEIVGSIGYGRVYPSHTGMRVEEVKKLLEKEHRCAPEFYETFSMCEMMGFFMSLPLPTPPCDGVEEVRVHVNKGKRVNAFSISLRDGYTKTEAMRGLNQKFGRPFSHDWEFTIWRQKYMVISINHESNSIYIIDERL